MKKIFLIILIFISLIGCAQEDFVLYPSDLSEYQSEFNLLISESQNWYDENVEVLSKDYTSIDNSVFNIKANSAEELASQISEITDDKLLRARSVYIWLVFNIKYSLSVDDDYIELFKQKEGECESISDAFITTCRLLGIQSTEIIDYPKDFKYYVDNVGHSYTVFSVDDKLYYCDPTFGLQTTSLNPETLNYYFIMNIIFSGNQRYYLYKRSYVDNYEEFIKKTVFSVSDYYHYLDDSKTIYLDLSYNDILDYEMENLNNISDEDKREYLSNRIKFYINILKTEKYNNKTELKLNKILYKIMSVKI